MFKYSLEPVLKHHKDEEEIAQKQLAIVKKLLADENKKLQVYHNAKIRLVEELRYTYNRGINVNVFTLYSNYFQKLATEIDDQKKKVKKVKTKVESKREKLIEIMKKRKMLDKLREKSFKEYKKEIYQNEQKFMNEMAIYRYCQKK